MASDGVSDAAAPDGQMYEEARFMESIRRHAGKGVGGNG